MLYFANWRRLGLLGMLVLVACGSTPVTPARLTPNFATAAPAPTTVVLTPMVLAPSGDIVPTPGPKVCATVVAVCWDDYEQAIVAHICYEEAAGLGEIGMASCAAAIANRQAKPYLWPNSGVADIVRPDQFAVKAARTRPWEHGFAPPADAVAAVQLFLTDPAGVGCWQFDSFQASTPTQAEQWLRLDPAKHCIVVLAPFATLYFNWRDG